jgi:hypothetical protein
MPPRYIVFFKGKDADAISQAFKEFVNKNDKRQDRPSVRQKIKDFQKTVMNTVKKELTRDKKKDRSNSL